MLFDPRPKERREDLYGRDEELERLVSLLRSGPPIIVVLGIRRIGKTSLVRVALNEAGLPSLYIDCRELESRGYSRAALYAIFSRELTHILGRWRSLVEHLRRIRGVSVVGYSVQLDWRERSLAVTDVLDQLDSWARSHGVDVVVAIDEAQKLRFMAGGRGRIDFREVIAYSYDNHRRIRFLVTGSEVGVLHDFMGFNNPETPLYGRAREELHLDRFTWEKSRDFLEKGFQEHNIKPPREAIEKAVETLDGIPGWLTFYGYQYITRIRSKAQPPSVEEIAEEAAKIAQAELKHLEQRSRLYTLALKAIALGCHRWKDIKRVLELWSNRPLTNAQVTRILKGLEKMSIITKTAEGYKFLDPIYERAARTL